MKKILYSILILFIVVAITGCKDKEQEGKSKNEVSYHLIEMSNGNDFYQENDIKKLDLNYELMISLADNKAILKLGDYILNLKVTDKELIDEYNEETLTYEKNGNRIIINYNGEKLVFAEN